MTEKNNELFILSSFSETMTFPNATITSGYNREELVLFKIDLNNFMSEFILKSSGNSHFSNGLSLDAAGPIQFDKDDLFLTSNFQSQPLIINNSAIYGNSGNNESNGLLYKLKFNSASPSGEIIVENTCFNTTTNFEVKGTFDSILWDFDDPNSITNNSATINNPQHQFSTKGVYNVSAIIHCGTETQTIKKKIPITDIPNDFTLNPIYSCETNAGSGYSNSFDTSNLNSTAIGNQTNLIVEYINENGISLPSPLPNPYTNTIKNEETIKVRTYFANNPQCFVEKDLKLYTKTKPAKLTITTPQNFCLQQNATLNSISITGQNIKWYDSLTAGALLPKTAALQDGKTYYTSQTINSCESEKIPVTINIQNTLAPTGNANQQFCTAQNPTIANILVTGNSIKWYDAANNGSLLAETTSLQNGKTYYASQTINNCEGPRFGITISILNTPSAPIGNTSQAFCKNQNPTINNIQISGQNIKWYDTNSSTTSLSNTTLLENNKTYYASQTVGCESARTAILVIINDTALPTGSNNQQFCIYENATIANLNITGNNLKWYNSAVNGNNLQESILQNGVYYVTQTLNNCESDRYAVTVKVQDTQIPIADSPQVFCIQKNALIRNIDITGQNIKWYDSNTSSTSLTESTLLANGITYYASQIINNCESDRIPIAINILNATASDCVNLIDELPYPKFFTPNNDGFNDHWTIDFAYLAPNSTIKIFDRYGKLIKELISGTSWDGTYQNLLLPSTDYWFVVTRLNGTEFRAHFSLKR